MRPLEQTQREFFSALQMPLRGRSRASTDLPPVDEGHSSEFLEAAERLLKPAANLTPAESLELYHRQYWFRLLDSIEEDFPILQKMAGADQFWNLMEAYLSACPSGSFTLRHLGNRLADFTASWGGLDEVRRRWFSALIRLEYAYMEVFEAAEWEPVAPQQFATAELGLQPHVKLLRLSVPADLCRDWETFSPVDESVTHLAVWRPENGSVAECRLDSVEFILLERLRAGGTVESLFQEPLETEPSPEEISQWFASWQRRRWIALTPAVQSEDFPVVHHRPIRNVDWSRIDKMGSQARAMED